MTGATGGVGAFAVQLACPAGLRVIAQMRREEDRAFVEALGPYAVVVTEDGASLDAHAPFDLVIDGVGGALLAAALKRLTTDGLAVTYAGTTDTEVRFNVYDLAGRGRARLHGLNLYAATEPFPAARGFARLLGRCAAGRLAVPIAHTEDWTNTDTLARALMERRFCGKAVLTVGA